jgi:ribulose-phosphate 3-epimerase
MSKAVRIAPSILSADFSRLGQHIAEAEAAGADLIHVDVMDGVFVPNITIGPLVVEAVRRSTKLPLDVHLMIVEPARHIEAFASAGANSITVHYEADHNLHSTLTHIKSLGCKAGVAINPHTPPTALMSIISIVDLVLVMTVNPGFGGQTFIADTMTKLNQIRALTTKIDHEIALEVDGGINMETAAIAVNAGADLLVAGSAIFNDKHSVAENIQNLRKIIG